MNESRLTRRQFIQSGAAAAGVLASGSFAPASALGANDRISFAVIGVGGMGTSHLKRLLDRAKADNISVSAVCDVYQRRLSEAKERCKCDGYMDYRRTLERKDIDAVLIATPDHWHTKIAEEAIQAGKHVYLEKPMSHTIEQALSLRDLARKHKDVVLQIGPQATSDDCFWKAQAAIQTGKVGKITWAHGTYNRNVRECIFNTYPERVNPNVGPKASGDDFIDWDMWLGWKWGLAPKIPFNGEHFFHFRKFWAYNGGVATDLLYHKLAPLLLAMAGDNGAYPKFVTGSGGQYIEKDGRDIPDMFVLTADFPEEFSIVLVSTLTNNVQLPNRIYGKYGTIEAEGDPVLRFNGDFKEEFRTSNGGQDEVRLARSPRSDHTKNFLNVIRGTEKQLHCNVELGTAAMVTIKMAVDSYRFRRTLEWDPVKEKVIG